MQAQAALRVPSTVVPNESNYFLNPLHPDFKEAKVGEPQNFALDVRLKTSFSSAKPAR
ncbi:MAG: RES family NAD+ phosphorylase [Puniceicoccaceae bacterium]|nr:RES family NAD+ phosphorylase [Puniceicoccaceae bacterium]MBL6837787.1 RES family NAD+ phosphorylase [Puniceicoccaceae bacterium]MBL6913534.1 RES family NAD+ phosphorylase [Puniceicoccaceae bacterium]